MTHIDTLHRMVQEGSLNMVETASRTGRDGTTTVRVRAWYEPGPVLVEGAGFDPESAAGIVTAELRDHHGTWMRGQLLAAEREAVA